MKCFEAMKAESMQKPNLKPLHKSHIPMTNDPPPPLNPARN